MPLHLLGKKSWNPYSPAAIARVKADEEAYQALEQQYAERLASYESQRHLAELRGVPCDARPPTPPPQRIAQSSLEAGSLNHRQRSRDEKTSRRKLASEDDTDRDIRLARTDAERRDAHKQTALLRSDKNARITDAAGHIQLFDEPKPKILDKEQRAQERQREQAEGGMRFKHASGYQTDIKEKPWYYSGTEELEASLSKKIIEDAQSSRDDAWRAREEQRVTSADPMTAMMKGIGQMKQVRAERDRLNREREMELAKLREEQERRERREERLRVMGHRRGADGASRRSSHRHHSRRESQSRSRSRSPRVGQRSSHASRDRRDERRRSHRESSPYSRHRKSQDP